MHNLIRPLITMAFIAVGFILPASILAKAQSPLIIQESFNDTSGFKALNINQNEWEIINGELRNKPGSTTNFEFGKSNWNDYDISFKLRRLRVEPKQDQHFGIMIRNSTNGGIRLYCRGDSINYMADSRHDVLAKFTKNLLAGPKSSWTNFNVVVKGSQIKMYVDNVLLGKIDNIVPSAGKIQIYAYNLDIALKDLKVIVTRIGGKNSMSNASSKNILHNSGFEQCTLDDLPDYWGCPHWGLADPYWVTRFEEWQKYFVTDSSMPYEGKRSMKIVNPKNKPSSGLTLWSVSVGAKKDEKYTFSAYMRSKPAGVKVRLDKKILTLTDKWQRYTTTFINGNKQGPYSDMLNIVPISKGTVWIDAVQLENGPLTAYQPLKNEKKQLEIQEGNVNKILTDVPKYQSPYYRDQIILDGKLTDKIWQKIPEMELGGLSGGKVKYPTETKVWYNDKGIYIGAKCFSQNTKNNKCKVTSRDGNIWNDPSLEIFIDTNLSRNFYLHLGVNQNGVQFDAFCNDMSWNGTWKAKTYTDQAGKYWSTEIFLPFGEMGINRSGGDWWGLNICRNNPAVGETSCWSPTYGTFHNATRFGQINIKREIQENYYIGCSDAKLQCISTNKVSLAVTLNNHTKQQNIYNLSAKLLNAKKQVVAEYSRPVDFKSNKDLTVKLGNINLSANTKYSLMLNLYSRKQGDLCFSETKHLELPEPFTIQPQYDLYTREKEMLVQIRMNLQPEILLNSTLEFKICNTSGDVFLSKALKKLRHELKTSIDIASLKEGNYVLKAKLKTGTGIVTSAKTFRVLPPVNYETKVDHFSRMVRVNGKAFFPIGIALEGNTSPECIKYFKENGINSINVMVSMDNYPRMTKILDSAAKNNLTVLLQFPLLHNDDLRMQATKFIKKYKDHPAVLAWFLFDEAFTIEWGKNNYSTISKGINYFKQIDPYHLCMTNENSYGLSFLKNNKLDFPGAVISVDHYVYPPSGCFQLISTYAQSMEKMGRKDKKPCWMYLNSSGYTFWTSRDCTPQEQEFQTYAAIINGIRGIHYFADHPKSKSHWARMKGLFKEIKELSPVLASTIKVPNIKCNSPAIEYLVKKHNGGVYLIAVNNTTEPVNARFDISNINVQVSSAEVLFENRQTKTQQSVLEDKFEGFQRHVYLLKN